MKCECADNLCPNHQGRDCPVLASSRGKHIRLYRIDMLDKTGTLFCPDCAEDALESGLFAPMKNPFLEIEPEPCHFHNFGVGNCTCEGEQK